MNAVSSNDNNSNYYYYRWKAKNNEHNFFHEHFDPDGANKIFNKV